MSLVYTYKFSKMSLISHDNEVACDLIVVCQSKAVRIRTLYTCTYEIVIPFKTVTPTTPSVNLARNSLRERGVFGFSFSHSSYRTL